MKALYSLSFAGLFIFSSPSGAEPGPTFMGISLEYDFLVSVPACSSDINPRTLCRMEPAVDGQYQITGYQPLANLPGSTMTVRVNGGKVTEIAVTGKASGIQLVKESLSYEYGNPTELKSQLLTLPNRASFLAEVVSWRKPTYKIELQRIDSDLSAYSAKLSRVEKVALEDEAGSVISDSVTVPSSL